MQYPRLPSGKKPDVTGIKGLGHNINSIHHTQVQRLHEIVTSEDVVSWDFLWKHFPNVGN